MAVDLALVRVGDRYRLGAPVADPLVRMANRVTTQWLSVERGSRGTAFCSATTNDTLNTNADIEAVGAASGAELVRDLRQYSVDIVPTSIFVTDFTTNAPTVMVRLAVATTLGTIDLTVNA